jgi:hypothetical protein
MAGLKQVVVQNGTGSKVLVKPVVFEVPLSSEQKTVVARFTGRFVNSIQFSEDELKFITGAAAGKSMP